MGKFQGFSEMALLYTDKYYIIEAMRRTFAEEQKLLLENIEYSLMKNEWFPSQKNLHPCTERALYLKLCLKFKQPVLEIEIRLGRQYVEHRNAWLLLRLGDEVKNVDEVKERVRQLAQEDLRNFENAEDKPLRESGSRRLMEWDISYTLDNIVETICAEVERLEPLFKYVEQAIEESEQPFVTA